MTARRESRCDRSQNADPERQQRKPSEHLANGHGLDLLRLVKPLACHLTKSSRRLPGNAAAGNRSLRRRRSLPPPWRRCQADCRAAGAKARRRRGGDPRVPERVPERWRRAVSRLAPGSSAGQHRRGRRGGRDPVSAATKHGTGSPPSPPKPETTSGKRRLTPRGSRRADRILAAPFEPPVPAATQTVEVVAAHLGA